MDSVVFDGVEYVKASVIAKRFRYTQDYVGQLCRAKKIDARLVGRTWFVNPHSLDDHRAFKYKKSTDVVAGASTDSLPEISKEIKLERKSVAPVIKRTTSRMASMLSSLQSPEEQKVVTRHLRVDYQKDEGALFPKLIRKEIPPPTALHVVPAEAKKVRIEAKTKHTNFLPEPLPEVYLSGTLEVHDVLDQTDTVGAEETREDNHELLKTKLISEGRETDSEPKKLKVIAHDTHLAHNGPVDGVSTANANRLSQPIIPQEILRQNPTRVSRKISIQAEDVGEQFSALSSLNASSRRGVHVRRSTVFLSLTSFLILLSATIIAIFILSSANLLVVSGDEKVTTLVFQLDTWLDFFDRLSKWFFEAV